MSKKTRVAITNEEKKVILKLREEEKRNLPVKVGVLKENLYHADVYFEDYCSESQKNNFIESIHAKFDLVCPKGTKFYCYCSGKLEQWCSDCGNISDWSKEWAKENLEKIKKLRQ